MATCPPYPTHPSDTAGGVLRHAHWWQRTWVRYGALITLLTLSGLVILALVREQTGTEGFLVGLGLAVLPVPLLLAAFRWLDRVEPGPWRNLLFAFAWGACAAALIAIVTNSFATRWIATATADPSSADTIGATVIAPVVEESAKAAAVLLVFLFRRRDFTGIVDGVVIAGVTATGFAFTENILYLGTAFGTDQLTGDRGIASVTAATFFVRVIMSPFAHPSSPSSPASASASPRCPPSAGGYGGCCCRCPGCCSRWGCTRSGTARRSSASTGSSRCTRASWCPRSGC